MKYYQVKVNITYSGGISGFTTVTGTDIVVAQDPIEASELVKTKYKESKREPFLVEMTDIKLIESDAN